MREYGGKEGRERKPKPVFVNIVVVFNPFLKLATHLFSIPRIVRFSVNDKNGSELNLKVSHDYSTSRFLVAS